MGYITFKDHRTGESWRTDRDLNLICEHPSVGTPPILQRLISVPGAAVPLDCTEALGRVTYGQRPFSVNAGKAISNRFAQDSLVKNALHGKLLEITLSEDPDYYYIGRISVGEWYRVHGVGHVTISANCDPYKYRRFKTILSATVPESGTVALDIPNDAMPAVPTITTSASVKVGWNGGEYTISPGTAYRNLDIEFGPGVNSLSLTGDAGTAVTIEYQEGSL